MLRVDANAVDCNKLSIYVSSQLMVGKTVLSIPHTLSVFLNVQYIFATFSSLFFLCVILVHTVYNYCNFHTQAYKALAKKLRFLNKPQLVLLHANPTFNVPESEMQEALHLLEPPPRRELVDEVKTLEDGKLKARLAISQAANQKLAAARIIYFYVMDWFEPIRVTFNIRRSLEIAARKRAELNARNKDDDHFK